MATLLGSTNIIKIYLGSTEVTKGYLGTTEVFNFSGTSSGTTDIDSFIIEVKSDNLGTSNTNQFTIPTGFGTFLYDVATDDGYTATGLTSSHTITFPSGIGTHEVRISGTFPHIYFNGGGDCNKLIDVKQWGTIVWESFEAAFDNCDNITQFSATDVPNLTQVTSIRRAFASTANFNSNINNWDIGNSLISTELKKLSAFVIALIGKKLKSSLILVFSKNLLIFVTLEKSVGMLKLKSLQLLNIASALVTLEKSNILTS